MTSGNYYGGHAKHNLWSPVTMDGDFTLSQIWVSAGPENKINTVEAGWMVSLSKKYSPYRPWEDKCQLLLILSVI